MEIKSKEIFAAPDVVFIEPQRIRTTDHRLKRGRIVFNIAQFYLKIDKQFM
jgi:hypothetical protein